MIQFLKQAKDWTVYLNMVKMVNFMVCIFYHNWKKILNGQKIWKNLSEKRISKHQALDLKYIQCLFVNHTSLKLGGKFFLFKVILITGFLEHLPHARHSSKRIIYTNSVNPSHNSTRLVLLFPAKKWRNQGTERLRGPTATKWQRFARQCSSQFCALNCRGKEAPMGNGRGNPRKGSVVAVLVLVDCAEEGAPAGRGYRDRRFKTKMHHKLHSFP